MTDVELLNGSVYARVAISPLQGCGVMAIRDIPAGTKVEDADKVSFELSRDEFRKVARPIRDLILDQSLQHDPDRVRFYHPNLMLHSFMNYSSVPNTDGERTLRAIFRGEELTKDYRIFGTLSELSIEHFKDFL